MPQPIDDNQLRQWVDQGLSQREISRRLGVPRSTLQDHLKRQGITPPATPAPPAVTFVAVPEIQEILSIVKELQALVGELEQTRVASALPVAPAPPAAHATPAPPAAPAPEHKEVMQWTVRLSKALVEHELVVSFCKRA